MRSDGLPQTRKGIDCDDLPSKPKPAKEDEGGFVGA